MKYLIALSLLSSAAFAADPNFLTPADLPAKATQIYSASGRGKLPEFDDAFGIEQALRSNHAAGSCMAPVGRQLTDWESNRSTRGIYWEYSISALFECLAPKTSVDLKGEAAAKIYYGLKGVEEVGHGIVNEKKADVLCYERLEQVCLNDVLQSYNERQTCEIVDQNNNGALVTLDDLTHDSNFLREEGALALTRSLPVFVDGRRDDTPSFKNCRPHRYNQFKGISRKSAHVSCSENQYTGAVKCSVEGIIKN